MSGLFGTIFGRSKAPAEENKKQPETQPPKPSKPDMFSGMSLKAPAKPRPNPAGESSEPNYNPPSFSESKSSSSQLPDLNKPRELPFLSEEELKAQGNFPNINSNAPEVEVKPKPAVGLPNFNKGSSQGGLPSFSSAPKPAKPVVAVSFKTSSPDDFPDEELNIPPRDQDSTGISENENDRPSTHSAPTSAATSKMPDPSPAAFNRPSSVRSGVSSESLKEESKSLDFSKLNVKKAAVETGHREPPEMRKRREEREKAQKEAEERQRQEQERFGSPEKLADYITKVLAEHASKLDKMVNRQKELIEDEKDLQSIIHSLRDRQTQAQVEMDEASAQEDYEEADKLSSEIEQLADKVVESSKTISEKHNEYADLENQKSNLFEQQRTFLSDVVAKAKVFCGKEGAQLIDLQKHSDEYKQSTSENLEALSIEIEVCQEENSKRQEEVREKHEALDAEIKQQTGELEDAKDEFETKLSEVNQEIQELELKLKALKEQQHELVEQIRDTNKVIGDKLLIFDAQIKELTGEENFLAEESEVLELKKNKLSTERTSFESELQAQQNAIDSKAKWINDYQAVMAEADAEVSKIEGIVSDRKKRLLELQKAEQAVAEKQKSLQDAEEYEEEVKRNYEMFMQSIVQKEARIREIETRIPGLEADKKNLATARQFKDAGRVANEIKACYGEKEALEEELKGLKHRLPDEQSNLETTEKDLREMREELDELRVKLEEAKEGLLKSE
mmetsp:Transcript_28735/g.51137  ORF Transcript_28735/g.51137 Transcript_28735/m.51137 type:complete len:734 (+) Transcript_28735:30-2231(+)